MSWKTSSTIFIQTILSNNSLKNSVNHWPLLWLSKWLETQSMPLSLWILSSALTKVKIDVLKGFETWTFHSKNRLHNISIKSQCTKMTTILMSIIGSAFSLKDLNLNIICKDYMNLRAMWPKQAYHTLMFIQIQSMEGRYSMTSPKSFNTTTLIKYGTRNGKMSNTYKGNTCISQTRILWLINLNMCPKIRSWPRIYYCKASTTIWDIQTQWFLGSKSLEVF